MTPTQVDLLERCIRAVRTAEDARACPAEWMGHLPADLELVEVGRINGVNKKTARSLVEAGVLVEDMPTWADINTHTHVRLLRLDELQERERERKREGKPLVEVLGDE